MAVAQDPAGEVFPARHAAGAQSAGVALFFSCGHCWATRGLLAARDERLEALRALRALF